MAAKSVFVWTKGKFNEKTWVEGFAEMVQSRGLVSGNFALRKASRADYWMIFHCPSGLRLFFADRLIVAKRFLETLASKHDLTVLDRLAEKDWAGLPESDKVILRDIQDIAMKTEGIST